MTKSENFEHESIQTNESIIEYLKALIEGMQNKRLTFNDDDQQIVLHPQNLIKFVMIAKKKGDKNKLSLKFSWKDLNDKEILGLKIN